MKTILIKAKAQNDAPHPHFIRTIIAGSLIVSFFILTNESFATTINSTSTGGRWDAIATWVGGGVPTAFDDVIIETGATVTIRETYTTSFPALCNSLTVNGTLMLGSGSGSIRKLDIATFLLINPTGVLTNDGATLTNATIHQLTVGGDFTNQGIFNSVVFGTVAGSIQVTLNGTGPQVIDGTSSVQVFQGLIINKTAGQAVTMGGTVTTITATSYTQTSGDFVSPLVFSVSGNVTISAGTFTAGSSTLVSGNFANNGTFTAGSGTITFFGSTQTISGTSPTTFNHVILGGTSNTIIGAGTTINGDLLINDGTTFTAGGFNLTVLGKTTVGTGVSGNLTVSSTAGSKIFTGLVSVMQGGTWDNSVGENIRFSGGLSNSGTFTAGAGTYTFDTNSQALFGSISIPTVSVPIITLTNNGIFSVTSSLSGSGGLTQVSGATLNLGGTFSITTLSGSASGNTINYSGGAQTIKNINYFNLGLSGSGTKTLQSGTTSISGNLSLTGSVSTSTVIGLTIGGNLAIGDGTSFTATGSDLNVTGTTTIGNGSSGSFFITSTAGTKTFFGLVTVSAGATWDNPINENAYFHSGITNSGTFTSGSGTYNFEVSPQNIAGTFIIPNVVVASGITLTNNGTLTVTTSLSGTGSFQQGLNSILNIENTSGISSIVANTASNTVNYSGSSAQSVKGVDYVNLSLSGSGTKSLTTSTTSISGNLILSGTTNSGTAIAMVIGGNLTVGDGCSFSVKGFDLTVNGTTNIGDGNSGSITFPSNVGNKTFVGLVTVSNGATWDNSTNNELLSFRGGITNNGTFLAGTGFQTFDTNNQSLSGSLSIAKIVITDITLTNYNSLTVGTSLTGTGTLGLGGTINLNGTTTLSAVNGSSCCSSVYYNGATPTIIPGTYDNLYLNQSGEAMLTGTTQANGELGLMTGNLNMGSNNLILGDAASIQITTPSETRMIVASGGGELKKTFTSTGTFTFPMGDKTITTEYSPITVEVTNGTGFTSAYIGVSVVDAKHPSNASGSHFLTRYWNVTQSGITGCSANITGTYLPGDISGTEASINAATLSGTLSLPSNPWMKLLPLSANTLTTSGTTLIAGQTTAITGITGADPTVSITGGGITLCANSSVPLNATVTGNPTLTYSWSPSTGLSSSTVVNPTATVSNTTLYTLTVYDGNGISATDNTTISTQQPTVTVNNLTFCSGIGGTLTASGASTYSWSPATGLSATTGASVTANPSNTTTYIVTGTDANTCSNTATAIVTVNPLPNVSVNNATICAGGSASLNANGASAYSWSPATGLSATTGATVTANPSNTTTYTVTGTDANTCSNTAMSTVTINQLPNVLVNSATICAGASTSLTASGASTYSWSPSTGLSATTGASVTANPANTTIYTVTGTDANTCSNTAMATVTVNPLPNVSVNSATICAGASTSLTASGASTYSWSPATGLSGTTGASVTANPSNTTIYTVTGTDANTCSNTAPSTVTVTPLPTKPTITPTNLGTENPTLTSSSASGNQWFKDGSIMAGQTAQTLSVTQAGSYTVTVTTVGCTSPASNAFPIVITEIENNIRLNEIFLYPNPTVDILYIDWNGFSSQAEIEVKVFDLVGRVVISKTIMSSENELNVKHITVGQHIFLARQNNLVQVVRFVKQ